MFSIRTVHCISVHKFKISMIRCYGAQIFRISTVRCISDHKFKISMIRYYGV